MSLSLYDVSAPVFRQYLAGLSGVLGKAEAHFAGKDEDVLALKLSDDMLPFAFQVMQSITNGAGAVALLCGRTYPRPEKLDTLADCKAAVDAAVAYLDGVKAGDVTIDPDADVVLPIGGMTFTARDYLLTFAYGNFFFHVTTAYDLLRHNGVPIGKRDFLGAVQIKSMA